MDFLIFHIILILLGGRKKAYGTSNAELIAKKMKFTHDTKTIADNKKVKIYKKKKK